MAYFLLFQSSLSTSISTKTATPTSTNSPVTPQHQPHHPPTCSGASSGSGSCLGTFVCPLHRTVYPLWPHSDARGPICIKICVRSWCRWPFNPIVSTYSRDHPHWNLTGAQRCGRVGDVLQKRLLNFSNCPFVFKNKNVWSMHNIMFLLTQFLDGICFCVLLAFQSSPTLNFKSLHCIPGKFPELCINIPACIIVDADRSCRVHVFTMVMDQPVQWTHYKVN